MGIQMSKASLLAQAAGKHQNQDDMTKATDTTDGSSATSSPRNSAYTDKQSQRRIGSCADSTITRAGRSFRRWRGPEPAAPQERTATTITYSDPIQRGLLRSESLPVKCPPRRPNNTSNDDGTRSEEECEEESDHLMRMYDARTWALFAKITEHRKNHPAAYNQSTLHKSASDEVAEWNNTDTYSSSPSGQEMIFLFDL
jgi:hypothetical protein